MAAENTPAPCFVCRKHQDRGSLLPGGPVGQDDLVVVSHLSPDAPGHAGRPVYLGHLLVEPRRHAPGLPDLTDAEAQRVGWWDRVDDWPDARRGLGPEITALVRDLSAYLRPV